jgi:hypothetical protein
MKRHITRLASSFILAATLLSGCGDLSSQSPYASAARQAAQVVQAGQDAAQGALSVAKKNTAEEASKTFSWSEQSLALARSVQSAAASKQSVADWWRNMYATLLRDAHGAAGGVKILEMQPQPR